MMDLFKNRKRIIYDRHNNIPYLIRYYLFLKEEYDTLINKIQLIGVDRLLNQYLIP